ncbi:unnamed protein product [Moneuplotes crassus]|uniref:Uncharacterized protein n=1 Tax=Euplotes crassus TaxID=5936 RepID=A0AAD1U8M3_EUPCR|nr:unnamed protein product [Moneuplotes crassus]
MINSKVYEKLKDHVLEMIQTRKNGSNKEQNEGDEMKQLIQNNSQLRDYISKKVNRKPVFKREAKSFIRTKKFKVKSVNNHSPKHPDQVRAHSSLTNQIKNQRSIIQEKFRVNLTTQDSHRRKCNSVMKKNFNEFSCRVSNNSTMLNSPKGKSSFSKHHHGNLNSILVNCSEALVDHNLIFPDPSSLLDQASLNPSVTFDRRQCGLPSLTVGGSPVKSPNRHFISKPSIKKHKDVLYKITNRRIDPQDHVMDRYETSAEAQIRSFDKRFGNFKENLREASINRTPLWEMSKRIATMKMLKARLKKNKEYEFC